MPTKNKSSKKKTKISKSKKKNSSKKKVKSTKRTKTKRTKTKRTKTKGTKTKGTKTKRIYKTQKQLESDDKKLIEKCKKFNGKSKDCRSARKPDGRPECWYNYDTELCTGFVPKKKD